MDPSKINDVRDAARELIEQQMAERLAVIEKLVRSQDDEEELQARLAQVQAERTRDWAEAERLGWTAKELKRLGLRRPARSAASGRTARSTAKEPSPSRAETAAPAVEEAPTPFPSRPMGVENFG
ncbi:hypothetical protein [Actinomadura rupiterrae]|uniref:hypothetical protein n=1 Tax=Actinomadura rupiterrae TaxID=559627 RepID=UPI0020A4026E|nr:hypothetical protein [Actinomadura rupiterrae]MCP2336359.1 gamma-glutamyl phosphate reductase [Actinomadura rupiterrae]